MRHAVLVGSVLASLFCLHVSSVAAAQRPSLHAEVEAISHEYLDGLFAARPHLASFMGDHRFDDRMMDLSEQALAKRKAALQSLLGHVESLARRVYAAHLADDEVDLSILVSGAKLELLYLDEIRDWAWDPRLYDSFPYYDPREVVADRLSDLIHGDFQLETQRRANVIAELEALPVYLRQVEGWLMKPYRGPVPANWRRPPKVLVEQAIKANKGRIDFLRGEVKDFVSREAKGRAALEVALTALAAYESFLETELLPKADGNWQLGAALYDKKFSLGLQTSESPDEAVRHAEVEFKRSRQALAETARTLHAQLWPGQLVPAKDAVVIDKVKDALSKDHPQADALVNAHAQKLDALRDFIVKHHLVDLPAADTLSVEPMPAYKRGATGAEYLAPGVLERRPFFHATYYVDPIDPTWAKEKTESYLRGQNDYEVELTASHEAYPGHHTQSAASRSSLDALRATLWNGPMVEGWAVYGTSRMVALGWGGEKNLRYRFFELRGRMICAANLILDVKLQRGQMSDAEALRFMIEDGFQERATAEKKLLRAKLDSTQLCQYALGLDEIETLRAEAEKQARAKKQPFDEHEFNTRMIGHGSIAVSYLRRYVLGK